MDIQPRQLDPALGQFLRDMPKAELHIHIEGSLEPELIFALAQRNRIRLQYPDIQTLKEAYAFTDLQSFLDIYYAGASVLITAQDFEEMAWSYFLRAKADGIVRAEIFFDPQTHTSRGVPLHTCFEGLRRACRRAEAELGISTGLIMCFLRHLSQEQALETLDQAQPYLGELIGVGLDSSELGNPPEKFEQVFAKCRSLGLHVVAHAGEEGPPEYIESALDALKVERIDHGVQSSRSPALMRRLAQSGVPLTVCPLSNIKLCVYPELTDHPLARMLEAGLCVTVNSDDPAYFGGYLLDNFLQTFQALNLDLEDAYKLAKNSLTASFAPEKKKRGWLMELEDTYQRAKG